MSIPRLEPISHHGQPTFSLRQLDELNGVRKGTSFRAFKACEAVLVEGADYFLLHGATEAELIGRLLAEGRIYPGTRNLLLIARSGYERMQRQTRRQSTAPPVA